jgi:hypothetical protein
MAQEDNRSFAQKWKEFWGRKSVLEPIPFTETSILTQPITFRVGRTGHFLQLPSNAAAIMTSSTGQKQVFTNGGYYKLQEGAYTLQYVDLSERFITLPKITVSTKDGPEVSFTVSITYKISDPSQIIPISSPLQTLFTVCNGSVKNYIATHRYDELIGEKESENYISDYHIIQHIREQIAFNQMCRAFWLMDVVIVERQGNPEINRLKHERLVQANQYLTQEESIVQQQEIAKQRKKLEQTKAEQERDILEIRAQSDAIQSEILERKNRLHIELESLRKLPDMQHEQALRKIDALEKALEALTQAHIASGFSSGMNEGKLIESFSKSLAEVQNIAPQIPEERSKSVNELGSTIINLIAPKNKPSGEN